MQHAEEACLRLADLSTTVAVEVRDTPSSIQIGVSVIDLQQGQDLSRRCWMATSRSGQTVRS